MRLIASDCLLNPVDAKSSRTDNSGDDNLVKLSL